MWGNFVATYPLVVAAASLVVTGLCCVGFMKFSAESRAEKLWIPSDSPYISDKAWLDENFPRNTRPEIVIFESDTNVLTPSALMQMLALHRKITGIRVNNVTWQDVCYRLPIANIFLAKKRRKRRQLEVASSKTLVDDQSDFDDFAGMEKLTSLAVLDASHKETTNSSSIPLSLSSSSNVSEPNLSLSNTAENNPAGGSPTEVPRSKFDRDMGDDKRAVAESEDRVPGKLSVPTTVVENSGGLTDEDLRSIWGDYDIADYDYDYDVREEESFYDEAFTSARDEEEEDDIADDLPPEIYCDLVNTLNEKCLETSILEIWRFDEHRIKRLTQQDIINAVNRYVESPVYGYKFDYAALLGSVERNESGHIVGAKAATSLWLVEIDPSQGLLDNGIGVELDLADPNTLAWESAMIQATLSFPGQGGLRALVNAGRSFNDISSDAIFFDAFKMVAGYCLMFLYTTFMLGRVNWVELRFYLTAAGILSVAFGLVIAYGLSAALGLPYTPIHAILPFLCLGIGIDDMFVIVQCWYNLPKSERMEKSLEERIGSAMQHAGVAITVTSLTDVFAFGIGAVTILPGLRAFCVSCAIGIGSIYLLQSSWFLAWFCLDERRIASGRDGLLPCCITHREWVQDPINPGLLARRLLTASSHLLKVRLYQIGVLVVTFVFLGFGCWGCLSIRQEFDPVLLLPANSYLRHFISAKNLHFPLDGWTAEVYTGPLLDLKSDLQHLDRLVEDFQQLTEEKRYLSSLDCWWPHFKDFIHLKANVTSWQATVDTGGDFSSLLSDFLFSRSGSKYKNSFRFDGELACNVPAPNITATQFTITYVEFSGPEEHIPARKAIENVIDAKNFSSKAFSFSKVYAAWQTDEIIGFELWRNLGLAMVCVFVITLILLADLKICGMVLVCVVFTLVDVVGMLHFWGVTIDTISCINVVLAIGLCVDYAAHIAHAFIVAPGTRMERASTSLVTMGPAVINGGVTTFLSLVLLGFSESHAFIVFFKVFLFTVLAGLWHGLALLPVVLGLIGSTAEAHKHTDENEEKPKKAQISHLDQTKAEDQNGRHDSPPAAPSAFAK